MECLWFFSPEVNKPSLPLISPLCCANTAGAADIRFVIVRVVRERQLLVRRRGRDGPRIVGTLLFKFEDRELARSERSYSSNDTDAVQSFV